jgi:mevalonate kinase
MAKNNLYDQVVKTTHTYLGPAADRFIARQVQNHLGKRPEQLSESDLEKLIDWIQIAVSLLTEDSDIIEEYVEELHELARQHDTGGAKNA